MGNISKEGVSDVGLHKAGKLVDKTDSVVKQVRQGAGSNVNKQVPGMNNSIVPLVKPE